MADAGRWVDKEKEAGGKCFPRLVSQFPESYSVSREHKQSLDDLCARCCLQAADMLHDSADLIYKLQFTNYNF